MNEKIALGEALFKQALDRRAEEGRPIAVGFIGAGRMGTGAIAQIGLYKSELDLTDSVG